MVIEVKFSEIFRKRQADLQEPNEQLLPCHDIPPGNEVRSRRDFLKFCFVVLIWIQAVWFNEIYPKMNKPSLHLIPSPLRVRFVIDWVQGLFVRRKR